MSPSLNDMKRSKFLTGKEVDRDLLVTIADFEEVNVAKEGAEPDYKWTVSFKELDKPLVLNSTNAQILAKVHNCANELSESVGKKVVLYWDETVSYAGKLTGGIRMRAPRNQVKEEAPPARDEDIPF